MTTTNNNEHKKLNVPNIRFPEFLGEWEKCKLGDYGKVVTGNTPPTKDIENYENGTYLWASPADLGTIKSITETKTMLSAQGFLKTRTLPKGSVLVTCIGSTIGKAGMATKEMSTNQQINSIVVNDNNDNEFVYYAIQSAFPRYLSSIAVQAVPIISKSAFELLPNNRPYLQEQKKIGKFLSLLDERIATQTKIIDKLQSLIKGIGKQLFTNSANWKTAKIGEFLRIGNGKDYKHLGVGKIPVYGTGGQMLLVNDYLYDGDSVCIGRKGTIDKPMFLTNKFWAVDTLFYTYDFKDILPKFCYYLFQQINWKLFNEGTGVPSLSKSTIENIKVKIPTLEQQTKISTFLSSLERKAKIEEHILNAILKEKQYLLHQMFI